MKSEKHLVSTLDAPTGNCCGGTHAAHAPAPMAAGAAGRLFPIATTRSLGFQLGARTLRIDAGEEAYAPDLDAIRKAGFDPQPDQSTASQAGSHEGHDHGHAHSHGSPFGGATRLVAALVLAAGA